MIADSTRGQRIGIDRWRAPGSRKRAALSTVLRGTVTALVMTAGAAVAVAVSPASPASADAAAAGGDFVPLGNGVRIVDTANGVGTTKATRGPASTTAVQVSGVGGIPATGVRALLVDVATKAPSATTYLTLWAGDVARPAVTTLYANPGEQVSNGAVGGSMASSPTQVTLNNGTIVVVFAVDSDGALWCYRSLGGVPYWRNLGDQDLVGPVTAVVVPDGVQLFARDTTGAIRTAMFYADSTSNWTSLGGAGSTGRYGLARRAAYAGGHPGGRRVGANQGTGIRRHLAGRLEHHRHLHRGGRPGGHPRSGPDPNRGGGPWRRRRDVSGVRDRYEQRLLGRLGPGASGRRRPGRHRPVRSGVLQRRNGRFLGDRVPGADDLNRVYVRAAITSVPAPEHTFTVRTLPAPPAGPK